MADWPLLDGRGGSAVGLVTAATNVTTLANSGVAHVKGAYSELSSSLPFDVNLLLINTTVSASGLPVVIDLAVGASGSEQVVVANLALLANSGNQFAVQLPLSIPTGTRLAARMQSSSSTLTVAISAVPLGSGLITGENFQFNTLYGYTAASTAASTVDPGAVANTPGAWTQITASTTADLSALSVEPLATAGSGWSATNRWLLDVGVGAAASEVAIVSGLFVESFSGYPTLAHLGPIPVSVPAGSRLSVRAQCTLASVNSRNALLSLRGYS